MKLATFSESGHYLLVGDAVPASALSLAFVELPAVTPEGTLAFLPSHDDIPGNEDDAARGTRQIRLEGAVAHPSGQWSASVRPGSFYYTTRAKLNQTLTRTIGGELSTTHVRLTNIGDYTISYLFDPDLLSTSIPLPVTHDFPNDLVLRWEYTLARAQLSVPPAVSAEDRALSDPSVLVGETATHAPLVAEVPIPLGGRRYRLRHAPLHVVDDTPTTWPRLVAYQDGRSTAATPFAEDADPAPRCRVLDAWRGIIEVPRPIDGEAVVVEYLGTAASHLFTAAIESSGASVLNLNPQATQYALPELRIATKVGELLRDDSAAIYLYPERCVALDMYGNELMTFVNGNPLRLRWCKTSEADLLIKDTPYLHCLGHIVARPPWTIGNVRVYDTRQRGGGVPPRIATDVVADAQQRFDLPGVHLDGDISLENGVVIVRVARATYDARGEAAVRAAIEASLAAGIAYLIEVY